jgi:hypothetical protein
MGDPALNPKATKRTPLHFLYLGLEKDGNKVTIKAAEQNITII